MPKFCITAQYVNSSLIFLLRVLIFCTAVAFSVYITSENSNQRYDLGIKSQHEINLKLVFRLIAQTPLSFLQRVFIFSSVFGYGL